MTKRQPYTKHRPGWWMAHRERARIPDPSPSAGLQDAEPLGAVLPDIMKKLGLEERHWASILADEWTDCVGAEVARHTRPGRLAGKALVVYVDSSVWLSELVRYSRHKMLERVRERVGGGKVDVLRFELDPGTGEERA